MEILNRINKKDTNKVSNNIRSEWYSNSVAKNRTHKTVARKPRVCPECHVVWEDWLSNTIRKRSRSHGGWVWRELEDFPAIGCISRPCPECGDNPKNAIKVANGVC